MRLENYLEIDKSEILTHGLYLFHSIHVRDRDRIIRKILDDQFFSSIYVNQYLLGRW